MRPRGAIDAGVHRGGVFLFLVLPVVIALVGALGPAVGAVARGTREETPRHPPRATNHRGRAWLRGFACSRCVASAESRVEEARRAEERVTRLALEPPAPARVRIRPADPTRQRRLHRRRCHKHTIHPSSSLRCHVSRDALPSASRGTHPPQTPSAVESPSRSSSSMPTHGPSDPLCVPSGPTHRTICDADQTMEGARRRGREVEGRARSRGRGAASRTRAHAPQVCSRGS